MLGTVKPVKEFSAVLDLIFNQIRASHSDEPQTLKALYLVRWLPYLEAAFPIDVKYVGDGLWTANNSRDFLANLSSSWERDIMGESLMSTLLHEKNYVSGIYLTKSSNFKRAAVKLERLGVVTSKPVKDGRHTFTFLKAIPTSVYFGKLLSIRAEQGEIAPPARSTDQSAEFIGTPPTEAEIYENMLARGMRETVIPPIRGINNPDFPGWANLPPARPVAVKEADLVLAVRRMFEVGGRVDQQRLYKFILAVMADETPDESLDPQPLIQGLDVIASGMTGDFTPDYIAQQALYAYNNRQTLTVATGVQNHE